MSTATSTAAGNPGPRAAFGHTLTIARRNLLQIKSDPEQLIGMTIQPLMFLVLFVYVFGGAISGSSREYLQFALPGILVQGIAFTGFQTALGLNIDFQRGLIDRFAHCRWPRARRWSGDASLPTRYTSYGAL